MSDKILILGALPKDGDKTKLYNAIISVCNQFAQEVSSPIDTAQFKGTDTERYERAFQKVKEADLIIGELSKPSTGQGMELREAAIQNKRLVIVAKKGSKISGLIKGCPILKEIIYYDNLEELKEKLNSFFKK